MENQTVRNPHNLHHHHQPLKRKKPGFMIINHLTQNQCSSSSTSNQDSYPLMEMRNIPNELIIEILTWLPVKSLSRFKCVSKSWLYLISNQHFIKTHLEKSSKNNDYTHHRIIAYSRNLPSRIIWYSLPSALGLSSFARSTIVDCPNRYKARQSFKILGSCNGLICMAEVRPEGFVLWNPSTKLYKELPSFDMPPRHKSGMESWKDRHVAYGFGYDETNDDYKIVLISIVYLDHDLGESLVKVYSRETNSWKRIADFESGCHPRHSCGYFLRGKLHWVSGYRNGSGQKIVSLDLANETYGEVEQPDYGEDGYDHYLQVFGGCLSLFGFNRDNPNQLEFWVMKEYGVRESWTKVVLEPRSDYPGFKGFKFYNRPVFVTKDGEILFQIGSDLAFYNPNNDLLTDSSVRRLGIDPEMHVHVESLVVPDVKDQD